MVDSWTMDDTIISTLKNVDIISEDFWSVLPSPSQSQMMENQTVMGPRLCKIWDCVDI